MANPYKMKDGEILESSQGVKYTRAMLEGHEALEMSFQDAYPSLLQEHPDQWVAWGEKGVFGVSDSQAVVLRRLRTNNLVAKDVVVEYLDSNPTALIL